MQEKSDKDPQIALFFSLFFGWAGLDYFYLEKFVEGIFKLITLGGFGFWWAYDIFRILTGRMKDGEGKPLDSISIM